jgi:predicted RNA methylase
MLGFRETLMAVLHHLSRPDEFGEGSSFDRKYGFDTDGKVEVSELGVDEADRDGAMLYYPLKPKILRYVLSSLDIDYADYTFIDIGAGKGRNLLVSAAFPFRCRIGVEFSRPLCEIARRNLAIGARHGMANESVEIWEGNALDYVFPQGKLVVLMYYPFQSDVTRAFLSSVESQLERQPRELLVAAICPRERAVFEEFPFLKLTTDFRVPRDDWCWCLYESRI